MHYLLIYPILTYYIDSEKFHVNNCILTHSNLIDIATIMIIIYGDIVCVLKLKIPLYLPLSLLNLLKQ